MFVMNLSQIQDSEFLYQVGFSANQTRPLKQPFCHPNNSEPERQNSLFKKNQEVSTKKFIDLRVELKKEPNIQYELIQKVIKSKQH